MHYALLIARTSYTLCKMKSYKEIIQDRIKGLEYDKNSKVWEAMKDQIQGEINAYKIVLKDIEENRIKL
jgi:hypothetical protein